MPKRGDVVLYTQGEKTYNALVMQANAVDASLLGENGEPTLHLAVIFDDPLVNGKPKAMPIGYIPQVSYVFDAVHASHEFSDEYKREHGLHDALPGVHSASLSSSILARRGAGEWSEVPAVLVSVEEAAQQGCKLDEPAVSLPAFAQTSPEGTDVMELLQDRPLSAPSTPSDPAPQE